MAVAATSGLLAVLPLLFTVIGVIQSSALVRGERDPTWNDGDQWWSAGGAVSFVVVAVAAGLSGSAVGRAKGLLVARTAAVTSRVSSRFQPNTCRHLRNAVPPAHRRSSDRPPPALNSELSSLSSLDEGRPGVGRGSVVGWAVGWFGLCGGYR